MPRQPTKNCINMHDIIGQPLGALPDAVDATLRRPEPLDMTEIKSLFDECSFILLRAEEALSARHAAAFCALMRLLSEGFAHSAEAFEEGIKTIVLHPALLQTIHSLFNVLFGGQTVLPLHSPAAVELVQVVGSVCDAEALKEQCGALFMPGLAALLQRIYTTPKEAAGFFHLQRGVATALINLVKGSRQNKQRLSSWRFVAECCVTSVDVFFQLQCVELLFRVSRQRKEVFAELEQSGLPQTAVQALRSMPNDTTLLFRMTSLVAELNVGRAEVLRYDVDQVLAADTIVAEHTEVYFAPHFVVAMVTASNADNITIPYRIIRSITLGKDGRVVIKLDEFPLKLEALLSHTEGMDTVTLRMSLDGLAAFKQSAVRGWIVAALQARKHEAHTTRVPTAGTTTTSSLPPPPAAKEEKVSMVAAPMLQSAGEVERAGLMTRPGPGSTTAAAATVPPTQPTTRVSHDRPVDLPRPVPQLRAQDTATPAARAAGQVGELTSATAASAETQKVVAHLRRLAEVRLEVRRAQTAELLQREMTRIQAIVDEARGVAGQTRAGWQQKATSSVDDIEHHVSTTQELAAAAVGRLNEYLRSIKNNNQALQDRLSCAEVEMQAALQGSRDAEANGNRELRRLCEQEVARLERRVSEQMLERNALSSSMLNDYLHTAATLRATSSTSV